MYISPIMEIVIICLLLALALALAFVFKDIFINFTFDLPTALIKAFSKLFGG